MNETPVEHNQVARDFDHVPVDRTALGRVFLPLPEILVESGMQDRGGLKALFDTAVFLRANPRMDGKTRQSAMHYCQMYRFVIKCNNKGRA